jgi:hypothetical protein
MRLHRDLPILITVALCCAAMGCSEKRTPKVPPVQTTTAPEATVTATTTDTTKAAPATKDIPEGSGDYSAVLALAKQLKAGTTSFEQFSKAIVARKLPPHKLGDAYLMIPVPRPPPGVKFDARMMPEDWEGTWGEVAIVYWLGYLTRKQYDELHGAAHPDCAPKK